MKNSLENKIWEFPRGTESIQICLLDNWTNPLDNWTTKFVYWTTGQVHWTTGQLQRNPAINRSVSPTLQS